MHGLNGKQMINHIQLVRLIINIYLQQYAFFLLVLVVLQIVVAVFAFMYTEDFANTAVKGFQRLFDDRANPGTGAALDQIQIGLQCCGTRGAHSWAPTPIPDSCCAVPQCTTINSHPGCSDILHDIVRGSGLLIAWFAIIFAGIELVGVIFACCRKYLIGLN